MEKYKNQLDKEKYENALKERLRDLISEGAESREEIAKRKAELANAIGVSTAALSSYLVGNNFPSTERLLKIANHYKCSLDYLIGLSEVRTPNASVQEFCESTGLSEESLYNLNSALEQGNGFTISATDHLLSDFFDLWQEISLNLAQAGACARVAKKAPINDEDDCSDILPFVMDRNGGAGGEVFGIGENSELKLNRGYIPLAAEQAKVFFIQQASRKFLDFLERDVERLGNAHTEEEDS